MACRTPFLSSRCTSPQQQLHSGVYSTLPPSFTLSRSSLWYSCSSCKK